MTWREHIKSIEKKISSACGAIYRLRQSVSQQCLRTFYFAHAYFFLQFSILAWYNTQKQYLQRINSLHGKLVRLMTLHGPLKDFHFSANEMFKNMQLLKIEDFFKLELAKFMHRAEAKNLPENFENYFIRIENMHSYNLRSVRNKTFYSKSAKTSKYRNWLTNSDVDLWQLLLQILKNYHMQALLKNTNKILLNRINCNIDFVY